VKSPDFSIANRIADRTGFKLLIVQVQLFSNLFNKAICIGLVRWKSCDSSGVLFILVFFNIKPEDTGEEAEGANP